MATVAQVRYPAPTQTGWEEWFFHHQEHHEAIERSMAQVLGVAPIVPNLYPFFYKDLANWNRAHQQAHSRFCLLLTINGQDLTNFDPKGQKTAVDDFLWTQFQEHLAASQRLGTTIT